MATSPARAAAIVGIVRAEGSRRGADAMVVDQRISAAIAMTSLLVCVLCSAPANATTYIAEVTASSLNVRAGPSAQSEIVGSLARGERVVAADFASGWALVAWRSGKIGYAASAYLKKISIVSSDGFNEEDVDEEKCNADTAHVSLDIIDTDFECKKDFLGEGYRSCAVDFDLSVSSDCDAMLHAFIDCEAEFKYETKDGFYPSRGSETASGDVYVSYGYGTTMIQVDWRPRVFLDPVVSVRLNDARCSISAVYD